MRRTCNYNIDTMTTYQPMEIGNKLLSHLETEVGYRFTLLSRKFSCYIKSEKKIVFESSLCTRVATFLFLMKLYIYQKKQWDYLFSKKLNGW